MVEKKTQFDKNEIDTVRKVDTPKGYECHLIFKSHDIKVRKWQHLGYDNLIRQDEKSRTAIFTFQDRGERDKFFKYLYHIVWGIEL